MRRGPACPWPEPPASEAPPPVALHSNWSPPSSPPRPDVAAVAVAAALLATSKAFFTAADLKLATPAFGLWTGLLQRLVAALGVDSV